MYSIPLEIHYKKVLCIENNEVFPSISDASKKAGGYTWKYVGGDE